MPSTSSTSNTHSGGGTLATSGVSLFVSAAGAGLLSYPYAVMQQGIVTNVLLTMIFAAFTVYTDLIIVQSADLFRHVMRVKTYDELALRTLGKNIHIAAVASVILGVFGALVGFMIVIGDCLTQVVQHLCNSNNNNNTTLSSSSCPIVVSSRWFLVMLVAICIALPISMRRNIHALADSSWLAGLTVLAVGVLVIVRGANSFHGTLNFSITTSPDPASSTSNDNTPPDTSASSTLVMARWTFIGLILGIPISIFSLGNHTQVVPVFLELSPKVASKFRLPVLCAVSTCFVLYVLTGLCGYAAFRDTTDGDVLLNFPATDAASDAAKGLLAIHVLLAYPILLWPCRTCTAAVLEQLVAIKSSGSDSRTSGSVDDGLYAVEGSLRLQWVRRGVLKIARSPLVLTTFLVLTTSILSIALPQIAVVFGFVGATCATFQIYVFPGLLLLQWAKARSVDVVAVGVDGDVDKIDEGHIHHQTSGWYSKRYGNDETTEEGISLLSAAASASGGDADNENTSTMIIEGYGSWTQEETEAIWRSVRSTYDGEKDGTGGTKVVDYLSQSPTILRLHAYVLILIGVVVMIIGTGTYVFSTWIQH